jgi:hypothetical protein
MAALTPVSAKMRRFAIKGVLRQLWRFGGLHRGRKVLFENRIVLVDAKNEREARKAARRLFKASEYVARRPAADIARNSLTYLGIADVLEFGPEMDPEEVWYEFIDKRPAVGKRGRTTTAAMRSGRRR